MADVIGGINDKIVRRHPHVFGQVKVEGVENVLQNWEALKRAERAEAGEGKGLLDGVPLGLPALAQAAEVQRRVARVGFDWPALEGVLEKVGEELNELLTAEGAERQADEMGDLLFAVVNYARWLDIDPETSLRQQRSASGSASRTWRPSAAVGPAPAVAERRGNGPAVGSRQRAGVGAAARVVPPRIRPAAGIRMSRR